MALDPKRLLELLTIAEAGSFTKAAAARRVSQPALSNSIAVLERALGVRVLDRSRSGAVLTDFGKLLIPHAQALTSLLARVEDEVRLKRQGLEGLLSVGASPLACVALVPHAVTALTRQHPDIRVEIQERPDDELMHGLRTGAFDAVINPAGTQSDPPDVTRETLLKDRTMLIVRRDHPLARRRHVALRELAGARWVFPDPQTAMWRHIEMLFAAGNVPWPANYVTTNSVLALRAIILGSDSVTMSSPHLMTLELDLGELVGVPLRPAHFTREIVLRTRRNGVLSPLAQRFVALLRTQAAGTARRA